MVRISINKRYLSLEFGTRGQVATDIVEQLHPFGFNLGQRPITRPYDPNLTSWALRTRDGSTVSRPAPYNRLAPRHEVVCQRSPVIDVVLGHADTLRAVAHAPTPFLLLTTLALVRIISGSPRLFPQPPLYHRYRPRGPRTPKRKGSLLRLRVPPFFPSFVLTRHNVICATFILL